jgi:hypothetical protein
MAMSTIPPQAARRLLSVHPDVAKTLTMVALFKLVLGSISLDLYVTKCCQFEDFWCFLIPCYNNYEEGEGGACDLFFWSGSFGSHLFYTDDVVVYFLKGHNDVLCRSINVQMPDNVFNLFVRLCVKCKEVEIFLGEEFLYGIVVHNNFNCYPVSGYNVPEELPAHETF